MKTDIVIVGCGAAGLYCALNLPRDKKIIIVTKDELEKSDSFLAQGGICVLHDENDYDSFFEDTMRAGHYENNPDSVDIMIRSSRSVINELVDYGVRFEKDGDEFAYTKEGAHSRPRILFHEDETGKEITSHLLQAVKKLSNVTLILWVVFMWIDIAKLLWKGYTHREKRLVMVFTERIDLQVILCLKALCLLKEPQNK